MDQVSARNQDHKDNLKWGFDLDEELRKIRVIKVKALVSLETYGTMLSTTMSSSKSENLDKVEDE